MLPFWRYAVCPANQSNPGIPTWTYAGAKKLFEEAKRALPWAGAILVKRYFWSNQVEVVETYKAAEWITPDAS